MANSNTTTAATNRITEIFPLTPPPSTPSQSTPLQLLGFLTGDTVQVQGDTGELHFSVQFNVRRKEPHSGDPFTPPESTHPDIGNSRDCCLQSPPPSSSYSSHTPENLDADNAEPLSSSTRRDIVTRLRSGVLSPVKYYAVSNVGLSCGRRKKVVSKGKRKGDNVFDNMLKRRNSPVKPCNSYAFFLMENWGVVGSSSFGETNKRLSKKWFKLSPDKKKKYEDLASKDNARYKRQCVLLRNDIEEESGLPVDSSD